MDGWMGGWKDGWLGKGAGKSWGEDKAFKQYSSPSKPLAFPSVVLGPWSLPAALALATGNWQLATGCEGCGGAGKVLRGWCLPKRFDWLKGIQFCVQCVDILVAIC